MHDKTGCALITGASGNLGRLVAGKLLARGQRVIGLDLPASGPQAAATGANHIEADVRDSGLLREILEKHRPDTVYHLASLLSGSSESDRAAAWEINATASFQLLNLACETGVNKFFFPSSIACYGPVDSLPMPLEHEQWPESLYGATKVAVERLGVYFKLRHGLDFRCLRFPLVVSPYAPEGAVSAFPSHALRAAFNGEAFRFPVAESTGVSTLFLEDVVDSIVDFTAADPARLSRHVYNLHAYYLSAGMVAAAARERFPGFDYSFEPVEAAERLIAAWPGEVDDGDARRDWGWNPAFDFDRSVARICELLSAEADENDS